MNREKLDELQNKISDLLIEYDVDAFVLQTLVFTEEGGALNAGRLAVDGNEELNIKEARASTVLAERCIDSCFELLKRYNGLDTHTAEGALKHVVESVSMQRKTQAHQANLEYMHAQHILSAAAQLGDVSAEA